MKRSLLHCGCGSDPLPELFKDFTEVRLDINEACNPDIVSSMVDMGDIGQFDAILCQHALEHLYPHEVSKALKEFFRVLAPGGAAIVFVPDLQDVKATDEILLQSPAGPISGLDMIYGYGPALESNPYMAHKTGFVSSTLRAAMSSAGFNKVHTQRMGNYNLMGAGIK